MLYMAKLTAQLTFRVSDADYDRLQEIAVGERRKMNEVARALLERGLLAYERDGALFEPLQSEKPERPATITARKVHSIGKEGEGKKRRSG